MATGLKGFIIGILLLAVFIISFINVGILVGENNEATNNIGDSPALLDYKEDLIGTIESAQDNSAAAEDALGNSPISLGIGGISGIFDAVAGLWKTIVEIPKAVYNLTVGQLLANIFGDESFRVVIGVIGAIVILIIIFGAIKLVAQGDGG